MQTESMRTEGMEILKEKRGTEQVTFKDVVDHLADYAGRFPSDAAVVDKIARFLAGVEDIDHEHDTAGIGSDA